MEPTCGDRSLPLLRSSRDLDLYHPDLSYPDLQSTWPCLLEKQVSKGRLTLLVSPLPSSARKRRNVIFTELTRQRKNVTFAEALYYKFVLYFIFGVLLRQAPTEAIRRS